MSSLQLHLQVVKHLHASHPLAMVCMRCQEPWPCLTLQVIEGLQAGLDAALNYVDGGAIGSDTFARLSVLVESLSSEGKQRGFR